MRREHKNIEEVVPFRESLVFYAPLTQGDLSDHVSGVKPTTDSGCSYVWDDAKQMYLFETSTNTSSWECCLKYRGMGMGLVDRQG